jgi:protein-tyrosine phosphatase
MFGFFRRKKKEAEHLRGDWSFLATDMHGHFIPALDDGPEAMEESIALLVSMQQSGFSKIITTPHISLDYFPDTEPEIEYRLELLKSVVSESGLAIQVEAAAEYMIDEGLLAKLHKGEKLRTIGGKYVLIEMGFVQTSPHLPQVIFEIQAVGYQPILAHPERYNYYHDHAISTLRAIKDSGCLLQLNTIALAGYYGKSVKICAEKILKEGLYDFAGSDIHHQRHVKALNNITGMSIFNTLRKYPFLNRYI